MKNSRGVNNNDNNNNFWYGRVYFFLSPPLGDSRRETRFIKAIVNHTKQISTHARSILCPRSQPISPGRNPNWYYLIRTEKLNGQLRRSNLKPRLFKILELSGHLFQVWRHLPGWFTPTTRPALFLVMKFIMTYDDCHILSAWACECTVGQWQLNQDTPISSNLYQTE